MNIGGIVLCGGQSKRMGAPKAWLPLGGELMLQRVVRILREVVEPVVVVAAPGQKAPELPSSVTLVRDEEKDRGPLQGLAAGLAALETKVDAAYLSGCDVPFLRPAFVRRLMELIGHHAICVPKVGDYYHPLAAVYRIEVLDQVHRLLKEGRLRPVFLFENVATRVVSADELRESDPDFDSLRNLNTPDEYQQALAELNALRD